MKYCLLIAFVLLFQLSTYSQSADKAKNDPNEKIKQVENNLLPNIQLTTDTAFNILSRMAYYKVKGLSIAVIHNYKLEWAKGYGLADDSLQIPVTSQTLFQAGSISKSLNGVGVLKLAQDKKIDLYTDINTYLTSWKFPYDSLSKGKKISTINLLSHTAGLTVHGFGGYTKGYAVPTIPQVLDGLKPSFSQPVRSMYPPGVKLEYSGGGTTISQLIVVDVTKQPYEEYMYQNVLKPLGMTSSTFAQPPVNIKPGQLAAGYMMNGMQIRGKHNTYPQQAAAGLWTNPTDLSKYIIETQLAYKGKSHKVLNQQYTQLRLTPYIDKQGALGVFIRDYDGAKYFWHNGSDRGFCGQYYGSLEDGNGVVVMVNSDSDLILDEIINSVAKVYGFKGLNHSKAFPPIMIPDSVLQTYTGRYELYPKIFLTITKDGNKLFGESTVQRKNQMIPETPNKFFLGTTDIEIEFIKNDKGEIIRTVFHDHGTAHDIKKLN